MSIPVHAVATPLSTCHACRARRDERAVPLGLVASRHDFSLCQNAWSR